MIPSTTKTCGKCRRTLPVTEFHKRSTASDGCQYKCKSCATEQAAQRYADNKEEMTRINNEWRRRNPEKHYAYGRKARLRRVYGMSVEDWDKLFVEQGGRCAICGVESKDSQRCWGNDLVVDHDHETGKIRGLLCTLCNTSLGGFNDDPSLLKRALEFLSVDMR